MKKKHFTVFDPFGSTLLKEETAVVFHDIIV
jgi:hypothetical protein